MTKRRRRMFSAAESAEVWDRWQRGEGLKLIGRVFDRSSGAIFEHLRPQGGIRPAVRRRSRRMQSLDDREEISRGGASGVSLRSIAAELQRAPSTVSRELKRNGGHGHYRAAAADKRAWDRALRRATGQFVKAIIRGRRSGAGCRVPEAHFASAAGPRSSSNPRD